MSKPEATSYKLNVTPPEALVVYCSDPRFREATEKFIKEELKPTNYAPIVVPASIGHLGVQFFAPKNFKFMKDQISLLAEKHPNVKKVILINHQDCKGYEALHSKITHFVEEHGLLDRQKVDLKTVAKLVRELVKGYVDVDLYYASFDSQGAIHFEKL